MNDEMLKSLKMNGGVIQINFGSTFLDSTVAKQNNENRDKLRAILDEQNLSMRDSLAKPIIDQFRKG
jgi:membrane dipeptidase